MGTKFYWRALTATYYAGINPADSTYVWSDRGPTGGSSANQTLAHSDNLMSTTIAPTNVPTSFTLLSLGTTGHQHSYMARFNSDRLGPQTIAAGTWTVSAATFEPNAAANSKFGFCLFVYRPGNNTKVATIYDTDAELGNEWSTSSSSGGRVVTFSGSAATTQNGDILCLEIWHEATQSMASQYESWFTFDGTTEPTEGSSNGDAAASYLEAPGTLGFYSPNATVTPATLSTSVVVPAGGIAARVSASTASSTASIGTITITSATAIPPDGVAASTNLSGSYTDVDEDPDSPDAAYMAAVAPAAATSVRLTFQSPPANLLSGTDKQEFRIRIRKTT